MFVSEFAVPWGSQVMQWERICLPMQATWVRSLGWEDPLEEEMATHSSILACEIPWRGEPGGLQPIGLRRTDTTEHPRTFSSERRSQPDKNSKCHDPKNLCCLLVGASSGSGVRLSLLGVCCVTWEGWPLLPPGVPGKVVRGGGWLPFWVRVGGFFWKRKETDAWRLIDPLCHSWTGPSGGSWQDFPTLISRRQLCLTNSLKCQRRNVKAWGVVLLGAAWAG